MKTIQEELGGASPEQDIVDFREKAKQKKWNENVAALFEK
jgi:ATP-dependent Lon protease